MAGSPLSAATPTATQSAACVVYWFRRDLRLDDNPAWCAAVAHCQRTGSTLLPIVVELAPEVQALGGGIPRGAAVQDWVEQCHRALAQSLQAMGSQLWRVPDIASLAQLARTLPMASLYAEDIALPYEQAEQQELARAFGDRATFVWQSTLFNEDELPFPITGLPQVFTSFRQKIEHAGLRAHPPCAAPRHIPPVPPESVLTPHAERVAASVRPVSRDPRSSIAPDRQAGEIGAQRHWQTYLSQGLPHSYFETRNQLSGHHFSSQLSLDLAWGSLSVRRAMHRLDEFEATHGRTKSSYWLWFECMWREHFRWLARVHGQRLFHARGLSQNAPLPRASVSDWERWTRGETGQPLIDAGMHELAVTGYLSNRMRQIVASYWLNDMGGDWRNGAAWFESQLIDEDPYSNTGNWLYIAGLGTDPRGGRRFDPDKQAREHDPEGTYRRLWA